MEHIQWLRAMYDELSGRGLVTRAVDWASPTYDLARDPPAAERSAARLLSTDDLFPNARFAPTPLFVAERYLAQRERHSQHHEHPDDILDVYSLQIPSSRGLVEIGLSKLAMPYLPEQSPALHAVNQIGINISGRLSLAFDFGADFVVADPDYSIVDIPSISPGEQLRDPEIARRERRRAIIEDITSSDRIPEEANVFSIYDRALPEVIPVVGEFVELLVRC